MSETEETEETPPHPTLLDGEEDCPLQLASELTKEGDYREWNNSSIVQHPGTFRILSLVYSKCWDETMNSTDYLILVTQYMCL